MGPRIGEEGWNFTPPPSLWDCTRIIKHTRFFSDEKIFCVNAKIDRHNDGWLCEDLDGAKPSFRLESTFLRWSPANGTSCLPSSWAKARTHSEAVGVHEWPKISKGPKTQVYLVELIVVWPIREMLVVSEKYDFHVFCQNRPRVKLSDVVTFSTS